MVFHLNNRKVGVCGGKRKWLPAQGASSQEWPKGDKSRLVGGKNPGQAVTQGQSGNGQHPCNSPQVVSYVAFNVKPVMDALSQLLNGVMQLAALIGGPFFQYIYGNSLGHAVLASFWIQVWSCFNTLRVRVGASPVALISAYTNQPVAIPTTR